MAMPRRRDVIRLVGGGLAALGLPAFVRAAEPKGAPPADGAREGVASFDRYTAVKRARALAAEPFERPAGRLPDALAALDYDAYRDIRFRPDAALLGGTGGRFRLQLFHPGYIFDVPVRVNIVEHGIAEPVRFNQDWFDYGAQPRPEALPENFGFAGLRLHYPLNRIDVMDELGVFLGATYFRVLGRNQHYGCSARGLAIDTATAGGEEFPFFREFWIEAPGEGAQEIVLHALLDSESVAGAYRFVIRPGAPTRTEVQATLFFRNEVAKLGIAPLTSMFLYGEQKRRQFDDFRPEVHDSDGLLIHNGRGEWLWRPLRNPGALAISSFIDADPRGFGLLQRDRDFRSYLDLEADYQHRPSYWIEPVGDWGPGHVELVEIPTEEETNDNMVAFWAPENRPQPGDRLDIGYHLVSLGDDTGLHDLARVAATWVTSPHVAGTEDDFPAGTRRFVLEFAGGRLGYYAADSANIVPRVSASAGRLGRAFTETNPHTGGLRVYFDLEPETGATADLRCFLQHGDEVLSETWTVPWTFGAA